MKNSKFAILSASLLLLSAHASKAASIDSLIGTYTGIEYSEHNAPCEVKVQESPSHLLITISDARGVIANAKFSKSEIETRIAGISDLGSWQSKSKHLPFGSNYLTLDAFIYAGKLRSVSLNNIAPGGIFGGDVITSAGECRDMTPAQP